MKRLLQITLLLAGLAWCVPSWAISFTHTRGAGATATGTTFNVGLGGAPASGDVVACSVHFSTAISALSVKDGVPNTFNITANSPVTNGGNTYDAYFIYTGTGNATITVSWTTSATGDAECDDFAVTAGPAVFKSDVKGTGTGATANTPSITPAAAGDLLFGGTVFGAAGTAPAGGGTLGVWTGSAGNGISGSFPNGDGAEYELSSASSSTAFNMTQNVSGTWAAMIMDFGAAATNTSAPWRNGPSFAISLLIGILIGVGYAGGKLVTSQMDPMHRFGSLARNNSGASQFLLGSAVLELWPTPHGIYELAEALPKVSVPSTQGPDSQG